MALPNMLQLTRRVALGSVALILAIVCATTYMAVAHLIKVDSEESGMGFVIATIILNIAMVFVAAGGAVSYIFVASKSEQPRLLHIYGLLLIGTAISTTLLTVAETLDLEGSHGLAYLGMAVTYAAWGAHRFAFVKVLTGKLMVLGPAESRCKDVQLWGYALMVSVVCTALPGTICPVLLSSMYLQGVSYDSINEAQKPAPPSDVVLPVAVQVAVTLCNSVTFLGACCFAVSATAYMLIAFRLMQRVQANLAARAVAEDVRARLRGLLTQHWLGLALTFSSSVGVFLLAVFDSLNMLGAEEPENLAVTIGVVFDNAGDVVGLLLLSGIGTLVLREDPEAADINSHIRSLLRGAVMSGRADCAFEGRVLSTASKVCIASFPGKYVEEWKALTWLCERHELSTACVFLPKSDPQSRFGKHSQCPETPGHCWCSSLYGSVQPWGCLWFEAWKANIDQAIALKLELVVVFFQGQVGTGLVEWSDLPSADLWDGRGLGGSQKGEVAYLRHQGITFKMEDLSAVRELLAS